VNIYSLIAGFFSNTKIVVSERNNPYRDPRSKFIRILRNLLYYFADGLVFQTGDAKEYFKYLKFKKSIIIPNPINPNLPLPHKGEREKKIVTACRLSPQKNL